MMTDQAAVIRDVLTPLHRVVPALAAAWDGSGWHPAHAAELLQAAEILRPAVLALAGLVADLTAAGGGDEASCRGCCGAGTVACPRCVGSGVEPPVSTLAGVG
jgi:hypothetical protein